LFHDLDFVLRESVEIVDELVGRIVELFL